MPAHTLILHRSGASERGTTTETLEFGTREEVADYLERFVRIPDDDSGKPPRLTLKKPEETIEFSSEGGRLFFSVQGNLNQQNIPLSVAQAVERICGPEGTYRGTAGAKETEETPQSPGSSHRRKSTRTRGPLLGGILLLVTLTVQGFLFLDGAPPVYAEAKLRELPAKRIGSLVRRYAGDYATDSPGVGFGLRLKPDRTFALIQWNPTDPDSAGIESTGTYDFASEGGDPVIRLIGEGVVDISDEHTLNFYGYPLAEQNPIP